MKIYNLKIVKTGVAGDTPKICRNKNSLGFFQTYPQVNAWWVQLLIFLKKVFIYKHPNTVRIYNIFTVYGMNMGICTFDDRILHMPSAMGTNAGMFVVQSYSTLYPTYLYKLRLGGGYRWI